MLNILALSRWFPYPPGNGSKLRNYNLLRDLAQHHRISLLSFADRPVLEPDVDMMRALCPDVSVIPWKPTDPNSIRGRLGFFSVKPRMVRNSYSRAMASQIDQQLSRTQFDAIIAFEFDMAIYSPHFAHTPTILDQLQVGELYEQFANAPTIGQRLRYALMWYKHCRYLGSILRNFQACTVVSERERDLAARAAPNFNGFEVIPNFVDLQDYTGIGGPAKPNTLIYTGSFSYHPNYEAVCWFLRDIYPGIQRQAPDVHFTMTGHHANLPLPPADNVTLTGFVDDIRPYIANSWVSLVPLQSGGGTRLKILEAMALGTPVVSTTKGAEGLDVRHEEHLLLADTPEQFETAVVRLLRDPVLRARLAGNAFRLIQECYDRAVVMPRFMNLIEHVSTSRYRTAS